MLLSDAIRLGAMAIQPCHKSWVRYRDDTYGGEVIAGCVIATALYAVGERDFLFAGDKLRTRWPWVQQEATHPVFRLGCCNVFSIIHTLFEEYNWTREKIAEWVAQQEQRLGIVDEAESVSIRDGQQENPTTAVGPSLASPQQENPASQPITTEVVA